jgi:TonB family protein
MPSTGNLQAPTATASAAAANLRENNKEGNLESGLSTTIALLKDFREPSMGEISLPKAAAASFGLHVLMPPTLLLLALLLAWLLHWDIWSWFKPQANKPDLTFTLVLDTHAKRPEKALHKGAFHQKAGGKHQAQTPPKTKPARPPKTLARPTTSLTPPQKPITVALNNKPKPIPALKPQAVIPPTIKKPAFAPVIASKATVNPLSQAAPVTTIMPPTTPDETATNPQAGPTPQDGVDVVQDIDFGPFMADLEKRIKHNWVPPRGAESRKVRLMLYLQRDGQLLKIETLISSGDQNADQAAVAAAEASAPFMAFPAQIKEDVLPVEFTFDYNVLNLRKREPL